jgi:hypothetical protein
MNVYIIPIRQSNNKHVLRSRPTFGTLPEPSPSLGSGRTAVIAIRPFLVSHKVWVKQLIIVIHESVVQLATQTVPRVVAVGWIILPRSRIARMALCSTSVAFHSAPCWRGV